MSRDPEEPTPPRKLTYRDAGVDIDGQDEGAARASRRVVRSTRTAGVLADLGSFGGLFRARSRAGCRQPILVSSADGDRHQAAWLPSGWPAIHDDRRPRPGQSLRQRHPRAGRAAVVLLDYVGDRPSARRRDVLDQVVEGHRPGCREHGLRVARWRDGRDARVFTSRRRVRRRRASSSEWSIARRLIDGSSDPASGT